MLPDAWTWQGLLGAALASWAAVHAAVWLSVFAAPWLRGALASHVQRELLRGVHGRKPVGQAASRAAGQPALHVLLVVAHPDDECLFFGPTLRLLARLATDSRFQSRASRSPGPRIVLHALCLSTGGCGSSAPGMTPQG